MQGTARQYRLNANFTSRRSPLFNPTENIAGHRFFYNHRAVRVDTAFFSVRRNSPDSVLSYRSSWTSRVKSQH
jgi:hypothetical protein